MVTMEGPVVNPGLSRAPNEAERGQFLEYTIEKPWPTSRCTKPWSFKWENHGKHQGIYPLVN